MRNNQLNFIGIIFFFIGLIFLFLSWNFTFPIHNITSDELIFNHFSVLMWPGILLALLGLFLTGYYSESKFIKAICASLFPLILYVYIFYFYNIPTTDNGAARSMVEIFHLVGIDSSVVSYFQYPTYFTLNEITSQISDINVNGIAIIFFALYGILLGLYLYLFLFKETKNDIHKIALLGTFLYFTVSFTYLNYQWVPQTLALVFFFMLLITFNRKGLQYKILNITIFIALCFTHAFIPVIFLLFFGLYSIKGRELLGIFILMCTIYVTVLIFYTTFYFPQIIDAFTETIFGFGEYSTTISRSFKETTGLLDQYISLVNRIRVPLLLGLVSLGFFIGVIKKEISNTLKVLAIAGGFYLIFGIVYPVLGFRGFQFLIASLVVGIGFFIVKWKKQTVIFVLIIIILSIFGPLRASYDPSQFQLNEDIYACDYLAVSMPINQPKTVAITGINYGYFKNIENWVNFSHNSYITARNLRPVHENFFALISNLSGENRQVLILYNVNLEKELENYGMSRQDIHYLEEKNFFNNKIFECGNTSIYTGFTNFLG